MKSYGFCIWLMPDIKSPLYKLTKGFEPHISLYKNLTLSEAKDLFSIIEMKPLSLMIRNCITTIEEDLSILQYNVEVNDKSLLNNRKLPNLPVRYEYDNPINLENNYYINRSIIQLSNKPILFNRLKIMKCDRHYTTWLEIDHKFI